jgi:murein DD-endopeptidase MepM/ murein hydrolase activator NlpD
MKFDYIPARPARRLNKRRVFLAAGLMLSLGFGTWQLLAKPESAASFEARQATSALPEAITASGAQLLAVNAPASTKRGSSLATDALMAKDFDGIIQTAVTDAMAAPKASEWTTVQVRKGQTLSTIFEGMGLSANDLAEKKLREGEDLHMRISGDSLDGLTYSLDATRTLELRRGDKGLEAVTLTAEMERKEVAVAGVIRNSLFADGRKAKLSAKQIYSFAKLFEYDVDFAQDLRPGDRFSVVYEEIYAKGKKIKGGDILAAEFVNRGEKYRAVRFIDKHGDANYYTPQGRSLRKGFMRNPVDFARVSSHFNLRRLHPILHTIRAHKGVDYGASIGTPIKATGDGVISFYGNKSGYGRVATVKHRGGVETLYAHLSRFKSDLKVGSKVRMGQVIGYVGMSGLATAPHLHYEFRIDGIHKNPMTVALPRANPVDPGLMARFRAESAPMIAALEDANTRLAQR